MSEAPPSSVDKIMTWVDGDEHNILKFDPLKLKNKNIGLTDFPIPDDQAVMSDCAFLKTLIENPNAFSPELTGDRYMAITILARLNGGRTQIHDLFKNKDGYSEALLDMEIDEAMDISGPVYCSVIHKRCFKDCTKCPHFGDRQIRSPIKIKGAEHIATKESGFWEIELDSRGNPRPVKPAYYDLIKEFNLACPGIVNIGDVTYTWDAKRWRSREAVLFKGFIETKLSPKPNERHRCEFVATVRAQNVREEDAFNDSTQGLINMANGVFDIKTGGIIPRVMEQGFRYILPYAYDPSAICPTWQKFLDEVTMGKFGIQELIMEFIGYCIAGGPCYAEKAMILYGDGANGKSTLMDTMMELAGAENTATLSLTALNDPAKRYMIDGKLFNMGEETNIRSLGDSEVFKTMVTGGNIDIKKLYSQPYTIKNRTKLIVAANELPKSKDRSHGLYRRMILVPFDAVFTFETGNKDPKMREKLKEELPGIFNMAIEYYKKLEMNGFKFSEPSEIKNALELYKSDNDNVLRFFIDRIEETDAAEAFIFSKEVYGEYKALCESENDFTVSATPFFKSLIKHFKKTTRTRRVRMGLQQWGYAGLKMK
jgi:P4 family phage/plasmid primase-like protien